jgi:hypothetical protein
LEKFTALIIDTYRKGNTVFVARNGASVATTSHYQVDFGFFVRYFKKKESRLEV